MILQIMYFVEERCATTSKEINTRDKNNQTYNVDMAWFFSDLNIKEILLVGSSDLQ